MVTVIIITSVHLKALAPPPPPPRPSHSSDTWSFCSTQHVVLQFFNFLAPHDAQAKVMVYLLNCFKYPKG